MDTTAQDHAPMALLAQLQAEVGGQNWPDETNSATPTESPSVAAAELSPPSFGTDDLSISISFDVETAGRTGEIARLGEGFSAHITEAGALHVIAVSTTGAEASLTSLGHCVNDGKQHEAEIRLCDGQLELWLNRERVADTAFQVISGMMRPPALHRIRRGTWKRRLHRNQSGQPSKILAHPQSP